MLCSAAFCHKIIIFKVLTLSYSTSRSIIQVHLKDNNEQDITSRTKNTTKTRNNTPTIYVFVFLGNS